MMKSVCTFLDHEVAEVCGLRFFGSPYQPEFCDWAFNLSRYQQCQEKWRSMLEHNPIDVLLTHGPPLGHGDLCVGNGHQGCWDLLDFVEAHPPVAHIFGHIHEGYGVTTNGKSLFVNASTMNYKYERHRPQAPMVIDVPLPGKQRDLWIQSLRKPASDEQSETGEA